MQSPSCLFGLIVATALSAAVTHVRSQPHTTQSPPYELRASTVVSTNLSEESARQHGIERDPHRGVLNVTLIRHDGKEERTMNAEVQAYARSLTGRRRDIPLRETNANGYVSYTGTYEFVNGEVLDFAVNAKPPGRSKAVTLAFRDRMWVPKGALPRQ